MKFLTAAATLLAVFSAQAADACRGFDKADFLQSGVVQFENKARSSESCFTVNIDYPVPTEGFQAAVSTVSLNNYRPYTGLDYSIRTSTKNSNSLAISLLNGDDKWSKITVSYLVSSRKDIFLGSFIADTFSLFGCAHAPVNKGIISQAIPNLPQGKIKYQVATYISGIRTADNTINAELSNPSVDPSNGILDVQVTSNANPSIQNLHVSYVIWRADLGFGVKNFNPADSFDSDYQLIGVTSFKNSRDLTEGLAFLSDRLACVGGGCPSACITPPACAKLGGKLINQVCVACGPYEKLWNNRCQPSCGPNQVVVNGRCECSPGFIKLGSVCVNQCGVNQIFKAGQCICKENLLRLGGACRECPPNSLFKNGKCVCSSNLVWNNYKQICEDVTPACPPNSKWNQTYLRCDCLISGHNLIGNVCKPCNQNEGWNGESCVCKTGFNKINGVCRTCDLNSTYNGRDCVCNHGFYGNADKCNQCHPTCGKCSGPGAHECLTCTDVSFDLKNGYCSRNSVCPTGLFLDEGSKSCRPCSSYCSSCTSDQHCQKCVTGFSVTTLPLSPPVTFCTEICGDGKRFEDECDDGNTRSGDGCDSKCTVEKGWACKGGSSTQTSNCVNFIPSRSVLNPTGTVNLFGRVVQGIRLSYIPDSLTGGNCPQCSKLLWVRVISSDVIPGVRVNYLPNSKYQFLCEFDFNGLISIPVFTVSIQINPDYAKYFSTEDMAQIQVKRIDPAVLIRREAKPAALSFSDIDPNSIEGIDSEITNLIFNGN